MITIVKAGSLPGLPIGKLHKATDADVAIEAEPQHATKMLGKIFMLYQFHYASCICISLSFYIKFNRDLLTSQHNK